MSTIMMRREVVAEIGGFRPELDAGEDVDFLLRAATTANFVANPEVLLVRHDHDGNRQWREPRRWLRNLEVLDRRWRAEIVFRRGRAVYVEWRRRLLGTMTVAVMFADADTEGRRAAARAVARLGRQLPWSARQLVRPVALLVLGARLYPVVRRIVRR